jgi:hypothetical protein
MNSSAKEIHGSAIVSATPNDRGRRFTAAIMAPWINRHGLAGRGPVTHGTARQGIAGLAGLDTAWRGGARQRTARPGIAGKAWSGMAGTGVARLTTVRRGTARRGARGMARRARLGTAPQARLGAARHGGLGKPGHRRHGATGRCVAWHGSASLGQAMGSASQARLGKAGHGVARQRSAGLGQTCLGAGLASQARPDLAHRGLARLGSAVLGSAGRGIAGMAGHGIAWNGVARLVVHRHGSTRPNSHGPALRCGTVALERIITKVAQP